jgi:hypothetical protein
LKIVSGPKTCQSASICAVLDAGILNEWLASLFGQKTHCVHFGSKKTKV